MGHLELKAGWQSEVQDAWWGIPYLALMGSFALQRKIPADKSKRSSGQRTVGLLIDNLSPVLFTLAITLMGVEIALEDPWLAFVCISAAVAIYGVRAAILQVRYARSQEELTTAMIAAERAKPRQEPIPGQYEPRNTDADEWHSRHDGTCSQDNFE
ncbi:MAG: hypothetical protein WCC95_06135 [Candidatus Sulfotelmatobacter sp.]